MSQCGTGRFVGHENLGVYTATLIPYQSIGHTQSDPETDKATMQHAVDRRYASLDLHAAKCCGWTSRILALPSVCFLKCHDCRSFAVSQASFVDLDSIIGKA